MCVCVNVGENGETDHRSAGFLLLHLPGARQIREKREGRKDQCDGGIRLVRVLHGQQ